MKILILGGAHQGKRAYASQTYGILPAAIADAAALPVQQALAGQAVSGLQCAVQALLEQGQDPAAVIAQALGSREDWLVICDEVGAGIVPMEGEKRVWRDAVGRICTTLAAQADIVERVCCGLPQRLKG
jgi:Adenosyl cobinamide kinase/adenosyl cobinamide phosphate guanylyltransferase